MKKKHLFKKIVLLLILAFINYSCFSDRIISKEQIAEEDSTKVMKMTLYDGGEYNLHTNDFVIENDVLKIKGENGSSVPFSDIKVVKVNEFDLVRTILFSLAVGISIYLIYTGLRNMSFGGDIPLNLGR